MQCLPMLAAVMRPACGRHSRAQQAQDDVLLCCGSSYCVWVLRCMHGMCSACILLPMLQCITGSRYLTSACDMLAAANATVHHKQTQQQYSPATHQLLPLIINASSSSQHLGPLPHQATQPPQRSRAAAQRSHCCLAACVAGQATLQQQRCGSRALVDGICTSI